MTEVEIFDWNILDGGGNRLDGIVEEIIDKNPDIVTLQECLNWRKMDFKAFAEKIGLEHYEFSDSSVYEDGRGKDHTAIFSRYKLKDRNRFKGLEHGAVGATIVTDSGDLRIYSIHLHYTSAKKGIEAFARISEDAKKHGKVIIAGDYNALTESDGWSRRVGFIGHKNFDLIKTVVEQGYQDAFLLKHGDEFKQLQADSLAHTYPSALYKDRVRKQTDEIEPEQRIDYVFVRGELIVISIDVLEVVRSYLGVGLSDHKPIYGVVDVSE